MGVVVILGLGLFLILMFLAGRLAYRFASRRHWAKKWCWVMGFLGAFAVWNTVFYETIPTNIAVRYLCATEGGGKIYESVSTRGKTLYFNENGENWFADGWLNDKKYADLLRSKYITSSFNQNTDYIIKWNASKTSDLIDKYQMQIIQNNPKKLLGTWTAFSAEPHGGNGSNYFRGTQTLFISGGCLPAKQETKLFNFTQQILKP